MSSLRAPRCPSLWMSVILCTGVSSCGGSNPTGPSQETPFPLTVTTSNQCGATGGPESATFYVLGFSIKVTNPGAPPPLEAQVKVGERVKVALVQEGCGYENSEVWSSQDNAVGTVTQDSAFSFDAEFLAVAPGTTTVFVDFTAMDKMRHRTTLGYCKEDTNFPGLPGLENCAGTPKLIGTVRVIP